MIALVALAVTLSVGSVQPVPRLPSSHTEEAASSASRSRPEDPDIAGLRAAIAATEAPWVRLTSRAVALALSPPSETQVRDLAIVRATLATWVPQIAARSAALRQRLVLAEQAAADRRLRPLLKNAGLPLRAPTVLLAPCAGAALRPPADGPALIHWAADALGHAGGLTIAAEPGAGIVAPAGGRVAYAAPFRRYGRIVVIEHGHGWVSLLIGFAGLNIRGGVAVRAGEPLGIASRTDGLVGLELTHRGQAVDAAAMMARCPR